MSDNITLIPIGGMPAHSRPKESSPENGTQQEENKTRGISSGLVGKYPILQKSIKNC